MESVVPQMNYPREGGSPVGPYPVQSEGPRPFYPSMCLKSHWDPTAIMRHTLPDQYVPMPTDPRPWTRICMKYTTAGDQEAAPPVAPDVVMPTGGQFYPPTRYSSAIDAESALRRLDRPLGLCEGNQYFPNEGGDMFNGRLLVPSRAPPSNPKLIEEISYPRVLLRAGPYPCRAEADDQNLRLSSEFMFNNATKQDKYKLMGKAVRPAKSEGAIAASKIPDTRADIYRPADVPSEFPAVGAVPMLPSAVPAPAPAAVVGPAPGPSYA